MPLVPSSPLPPAPGSAHPRCRGHAGTAIGICLVVALVLSACNREQAVAPTSTPHAPTAAAKAATPRGSFNPAPVTAAGEWTSQARDYANTRYSPLDQINTGNVDRLRVAWTFSDGAQYGHEGAPLVVGDTMYVVSPFPDKAFALDLTKPGAPVKWSFRSATLADGDRQGVLRPGAARMGVCQRKADLQPARRSCRRRRCQDRQGSCGAPRWTTSRTGVTMTMSGVRRRQQGVRRQFRRRDGRDRAGSRHWTSIPARNFGAPIPPERDEKVKIGARFKPFYPQYKGKDLGLTHMAGGHGAHRCRRGVGILSYDPETNLIYYGTSNPGPRVPAQRPGDNLWSSTMFARDADTGEAVWAYQFTPHDQWDYDGVNEAVLLDLPIDGKMRKTLVHFDRNTYAYVLDRETGEVLRADTFALPELVDRIRLQDRPADR